MKFIWAMVQAGTGQAPARQAAILQVYPTPLLATINKVCASGMKSVMLAAQAIQCGDAEIVVAGGMENMSLIPHYMNLKTELNLVPLP
jgi:acetyl-CoA C-acetyltransferase